MVEPSASLLRPFLETGAFSSVRSLLDGIGATRPWLLGGMVIRPLVHFLHGVPLVVKDYDFLVERYDLSSIPSGWSMSMNHYGSPKFSSWQATVDVVRLSDIHSIRRRGLEPTVENVLSGTPLNVQSIAYDLDRNEIFGDAGLTSLRDRVVRVHNIEQARIYADRKGRSLRSIIAKKTSELGFVADYSQCPD